MPAPTPPDSPIPVPTPPDRTDKSTFITRSFVFTNWYIPFQAWLVTVLTYIADAITWITPLVSSAETAATTATTGANTATTQAGIAVAAAASATLAPGTSATSTTSLTPGLGSKAFTLVETGKTFVINQFVTVASAADPSNVYFNGAITAFNAGTGAITVNSGAFKGNSSASDWTITGSAPAFGQRFTNPTQSIVALGTVSGTVNLDLRLSLSFSCTLSGNTTFTFTMPDGFTAADAVSWSIELTMGGSAYTVGYPAGTKYHEGANPITAPSTTDILVLKKTGTGNAVLRRAARAIA